MKVIRVLVLVLAFLSPSAALAACTLESIKGSFAASGNLDSFGFADNGVDSNLVFLVGRFDFDGEGKVTVRNGKLGIAGVYANITGGGRYNLAANCVGTSTVTINAKIPEQPNAFAQDSIKTKVKFDFMVSGTANDPRVDMLYTDIVSPGDSGLISLRKIRL